jgi:hypothetical protein
MGTFVEDQFVWPFALSVSSMRLSHSSNKFLHSLKTSKLLEPADSSFFALSTISLSKNPSAHELILDAFFIL